MFYSLVRLGINSIHMILKRQDLWVFMNKSLMALVGGLSGLCLGVYGLSMLSLNIISCMNQIISNVKD